MSKKDRKKSKAGKWILGIVLGILAAAALFVLAAYINYRISGGADVPKTAKNDTGLVQAVGRGLYDKDGNELILRGTNCGSTFITEGWLAPYCIAEPNGEEYPELSEEMFLQGLRSNPNLTDAQRRELLDLFYTTWFTEEDVANIAELGMNCLRIPFYYTMILNEDFTRKSEAEAFRYLDAILGWCEKYGVYAVLDLHGAPGSQNGYEHGGSIDYNKYDADTIRFWYTPEYVEAVKDLWTFVAEHYGKSEKGRIIASYDLLNEPRSRAFKTDKVCWDVYDQIYDAVRAAGDRHNLIMEGCWSFANLPNPEKYGWENVTYSYHWYNWNASWLSNTFFFMYQDLSNIGRHYDVPVFIGEFTCFADADDWNEELSIFEDRHYSWTMWTYKMAVYGWWENSWGLYNLNYWEGDEYEYAKKVNVTTAGYDEIREAFLWTATENATKSSTYDTLKKYLEGID